MRGAMETRLGLAAILAAVGMQGFVEVPTVAAHRRRPNDPQPKQGRRRKRKADLLNRRVFPHRVRKPESVLPAPPKGCIYVRDASKSGLVPKLVRR